MSEIKIALTFDDGPHPTYTADILATLKTPPMELPAIKAAFFVQTHFPGAMAFEKDGKKVGVEIVKSAISAGHVIGIHSGTKQGHICHRKRAAGVEGDDLKSDLAAARAAYRLSRYCGWARIRSCKRSTACAHP